VTVSRVPFSRELATLLSARLQAVVPDGVLVTADGADVVVRIDGDESRNGTAAILDEDASPLEEVATATYAVLSHVQDAVAEATTEPWPGTGTVQPMPEAEIRDGRLLAWFGDRQTPVLVIVGEADAWPAA
jgi:hypothetical protein